jgi:hypothetical protein
MIKYVTLLYKTYNQFCLLIIDKVSLVKNRMLTFIDCKITY